MCFHHRSTAHSNDAGSYFQHAGDRQALAAADGDIHGEAKVGDDIICEQQQAAFVHGAEGAAGAVIDDPRYRDTDIQ